MTTWEVVGLVGQACFFGRVLAQWIASEREKRSANPRIYWWLSLLASILLGLAALKMGERVLLPGYLINAAIYMRNLTLSPGGTPGESRLGPIPAALIGLAAATLLILWSVEESTGAPQLAIYWIAIGIAGQAIWSTRFILQWWLSERAGYSHFPLTFWWLSLTGSILNLAYTLQLESNIFWIGFVIAWFVPLRNLVLEYRHRCKAA